MTRSQKGFAPTLIIIAIAVVIIAIAGGFFVMNRSGSSPSVPTETSSESPSDTASSGEITSTLPDVIGRGENLECDFRIPVEQGSENPFNAGKLWTTGNQGRSTITANVNGSQMEANAIYKDNTAYTWMSMAGKTMGYKFSQSELEKMDSSLTPEERQQAEQVRSEMLFNCNPWTPDASKFVLPSDVNFQEL